MADTWPTRISAHKSVRLLQVKADVKVGAGKGLELATGLLRLVLIGCLKQVEQNPK